MTDCRVHEFDEETADLLINNTPEERQPGEFIVADYVALMAKQGNDISEMTARRKLIALEKQGVLTSRPAGVFRYYRKV